jgi:hypothetical protein
MSEPQFHVRVTRDSYWGPSFNTELIHPRFPALFLDDQLQRISIIISTNLEQGQIDIIDYHRQFSEECSLFLKIIKQVENHRLNLQLKLQGKKLSTSWLQTNKDLARSAIRNNLKSHLIYLKNKEDKKFVEDFLLRFKRDLISLDLAEPVASILARSTTHKNKPLLLEAHKFLLDVENFQYMNSLLSVKMDKRRKMLKKILLYVDRHFAPLLSHEQALERAKIYHKQGTRALSA